MNQLWIIGGGPGNEKYVLPQAAQAIEEADFIFADRRYLHLVHHSRREPFGTISGVVEAIERRLETGTVGVVVSGNPLFYSLTKILLSHFSKEQIQIIPGLGSLDYFAAKCKKNTEKGAFFSAHGRALSMDEILDVLDGGRDVYMLCDGEHGPDWLAGRLCDRGRGDLAMAAGTDLSYDSETIVHGTALEISRQTFGPLSVAAVFPEKGEDKRAGEGAKATALLKDSSFIRGKVPMTREELRWIVAGKLELRPGSIVWDIGAGTGSVGAECARLLKAVGGGQVYCVERSFQGCDLILENKNKFGLNNVEICHGEALDCMSSLPVPTHVFIGGSGRTLKEILEHIRAIGPDIRVLVSCVTLETLTMTLDSFETLNFQSVDVVQVLVSRSKALGSYHVMESGYPVTLCSGITPKLGISDG